MLSEIWEGWNVILAAKEKKNKQTNKQTNKPKQNKTIKSRNIGQV